jgi:predicted TIM-barrel fold metal-dependent hydrolase
MSSPESSQHLPTDCHFHVFEAGHAVAGARYTPAYRAGIDDWMRHTGDQGVRLGVLVQPSFLGTDNNLLVQTLNAHPALLRGVAVVSPKATLSTLEPLHQAGVRAIRLNLVGLSHDMSAWRESTALWDAMHQLGWHIQVHTNSGALPDVLPHLPASLPVVLDHMGKPASLSISDPTLKLVGQRAKHGPVHIKLSGAYRQVIREVPALCQHWLEALGPQALVWGSDWPFTNHEASTHYHDVFAALSEWLPTEAARLATCENPARLYGFQPLP